MRRSLLWPGTDAPDKRQRQRPTVTKQLNISLDIRLFIYSVLLVSIKFVSLCIYIFSAKFAWYTCMFFCFIPCWPSKVNCWCDSRIFSVPYPIRILGFLWTNVLPCPSVCCQSHKVWQRLTRQRCYLATAIFSRLAYGFHLGTFASIMSVSREGWRETWPKYFNFRVFTRLRNSRIWPTSCRTSFDNDNAQRTRA